MNELIDKILSDRPEAQIALNSSSGKDSQAMITYIKKKYPTANKFVIFADTGRMEWEQTLPFCKSFCQKENIDLVVVRASKDLIDYILQRYERLKAKGEHTTKPFWPSSKNRYCTSQSKVAPINKYLRRYQLIINCLGIRAEESKARAAKTPITVRKDLSSKIYHNLSTEEAYTKYLANPHKRLVIDYYPIFDWKLNQVWVACGTTTEEWEARRKMPDAEALNGWTAHPAYVIGVNGNTRLSCAFCVLGSLNDLNNAYKYNQKTFNILLQLEETLGWTFQNKRSLRDLITQNSLVKKFQQLTLF